MVDESLKKGSSGLEGGHRLECHLGQSGVPNAGDLHQDGPLHTDQVS